MTGCMSGQTDERAGCGAVSPGKPGQKRVSGHSQRRSGSQFEDARRYSRQNAWILPPGRYTGTRRTRRSCRAKVIWEMSINGKLADELLEREIFDTLHEAKVLIERWRVHYNTIRPHSSLGYRPPAPEAWLVVEGDSAALRPPQQPMQTTVRLT